MKIKTRGLLMKMFIIFSLISAVEYLIYHGINLLGIEHYSLKNGLLLIASKISEGWLVVFPAVIALFTLILFTYNGYKDSLKFGGIMLLTRWFYFIPQSYMYFMFDIYNGGYDSVEALLLSIPRSLFFSLVDAIRIFACVGLAIGVIALVWRKRKSPLSVLRETLAENEFLNLKSTPVIVTGVIAITSFVVQAASITVDMITGLQSRGWIYETSDLIGYLLSYLYALLLLVFLYFLLIFMKSKVIAARLSDSIREDFEEDAEEYENEDEN